MLEQVLNHIHNYFIKEVYEDVYTIESNTIDLPFLIEGQYFKIDGSVLNDGIYQYPATNLKDEKFKGKISAMAVPVAVISLVDEIGAWVEKYGEIQNSPFSSESFGGYSYSKAQSYANAGGGMLSSWQTVFRDQLNHWRKIA